MKKNGNTYISIGTGWLNRYIFDFKLDLNQLDLLRNKETEKILVVSIPSINKIEFEVISTSSECELRIESSNKFLGEGEIIDIIQIKKLKW